MKWITRERPKIDRIACPWLIKNFVDAGAEFIYAPADTVLAEAAALNATPFDVPGAALSHYDDKCTFDHIIKEYGLQDEALNTIALIVRAADTDRHELSPQAPGLWAISAGLAFNIRDDYELLEKGMMIYDALYSWAKNLQHIRHTQTPVENIFIDVYKNFISQRSAARKTPAWVKELKAIIQDQADSNISLTDISKSLDINPSYLSRKFSKHFDNQSFGEYVRKMRIEKATQLIDAGTYSLTEIAYLTGFSDQSHFTRIFKQVIGKNPSAYRKEIMKSKKDTKS